MEGSLGTKRVGGLLRDALRALPVLIWAEHVRLRSSLHEAAHLSRKQGANCIKRSPERRLQLRHIIARFDAYMPGGPNCLRRSLAEMAMDPDSARERLYAGLRSGGGVKSGHAWLESVPTPERYDAVVTI